jgi:hypothetical protein
MTTDNSIGGPHIYYYRSRGSYIIVVLEYIITLEHISWRSVLLVEETGVPDENHRPVENHRQTLSHNVVSSTPRH